MKYFICSDIHGSAAACRKLITGFSALKCDILIILGDILYHGPRNPLPEEYNPKEVCALLNPLADKIIACRGNCDAEVDQMVLSFPVGADYTMTTDNGVRIFASHGHVYAPLNESGTAPAVAGSRLPPLTGTAVALYGHTHVQKLYQTGSTIVCNPGSPALPKEGSPAGFALYENRNITLYSLDGTEIRTLSLS
jgi:uncharacterized protein